MNKLKCLTIFTIILLLLISITLAQANSSHISKNSELSQSKKSSRQSSSLAFSFTASSIEVYRGDIVDLEVIVSPNNPPDNIYGIDAWANYSTDAFQANTITDYLDGIEYGWSGMLTSVDISTPGSVEYSKATMDGPGWNISGADKPYLIQLQVKSDAPFGETQITFNSLHVGAVNNSFLGYSYTTTPITITVTPPPTDPIISVYPSQLDFANTVVNTISDPQTLNIKNIGNGVLNISSITSSNTTDFTVNASPPYSIAPGDSILINALFNPQSIGNYTETLTIQSDATNQNPAIINLTGYGSPDGVAYIPNMTTESGTVDIPVICSFDPENVISLNLSLSFPSNVFIYNSFSLAGTMMEGWDNPTVSSTPGELNIGGYTTSTPLNSAISDTLIVITFDITGCQITETIHFESVYFNSDPIPTQDGIIDITGSDIQGNIFLCDSSIPVEDVNLEYSVGSSIIANATTDNSGAYLIENICDFPGILTPYKNPINWEFPSPTLSPDDAAWILQRSVNARQFDDCQESLGDVDKDGLILAYDAYKVAIWMIDDTQALAMHQPNYTGEWLFIPDFIEFSDPNQVSDFSGGVIGDVDKSWMPSVRPSRVSSKKKTFNPSNRDEIVVTVENSTILNNNIIIPVSVTDLTAYEYISYQAVLPIAEDVDIESVSITATDTTYNVLANLQEDNSILIIGYGATPLQGDDLLFDLHIELSENYGDEFECCFDIFLFGSDYITTECGQIFTGIAGQPILSIPDRFEFHQNYPNPFNPTTHLDFSLPQASHTNLSIYNIHGHLVKSLIDETLSAGTYSIIWNGKDDQNNWVSSGIYIARINTPNDQETCRMILLR